MKNEELQAITPEAARIAEYLKNNLAGYNVEVIG